MLILTELVRIFIQSNCLPVINIAAGSIVMNFRQSNCLAACLQGVPFKVINHLLINMNNGCIIYISLSRDTVVKKHAFEICYKLNL
jgi:hypothetical protein